MNSKTSKFTTLLLGIFLFACLAKNAASADSQLNMATYESIVAQNSDRFTKQTRLKRYLGKLIFFDTNLSTPAGQSCGSCHSPNVAFTEPDQGSPTSEGVILGRFGNRNTPTALYAQFSPVFHYDATQGGYVGGQFWDGRAATLEDQAKGPFLNPVEMANPDKASVVEKLNRADYSWLFYLVYGFDNYFDTDKTYDQIADAIAAFERTRSFGAFSSKYDAHLAGYDVLTSIEQEGLRLFEDPNKGNCAACHISRPSADGKPPLFTDYTYDNIGAPKNPSNRFYNNGPEFNPDGWNFVDKGLGGVIGSVEHNGKFKVPTLRNLTHTAPYFHNGYFTTLRGVVDFYNTRDLKPTCPDAFTSDVQAEQAGCWPTAEVAENVNHAELGNLGLTAEEVDALVAFLQTLNDGYY